MLSGDGKFFEQRRQQMGACLYRDQWQTRIKEFYQEMTLKLLHQYSYKVGGSNTYQVDLIRDIGNLGRISTKLFRGT
jgi:hypothetical protein